MKLYEIEINKDSFDEVMAGKMNFKLVENTPRYEPGDLINFAVIEKKLLGISYDPIQGKNLEHICDINHKNNEVFRITYVLRDDPAVKDGYAGISFVRLEPVK